MLAAAVACLLSAGCGGKAVDLGASREKLDASIAESNQMPLLVDFWKWGCASCMSLEPIIDRLTEEYKGRVTVARFFMEHFWFEPTDWDVFKRYGFSFFPTVILFVNGKEHHRWVWVMQMDEYRKVLDPLVGSATRPATQSATQPATKPATRPSTRSATPPATRPAPQPAVRPAT